MAEAKRPLKVFLCHARSDQIAVRALYSRLKREGVDAWLDKEKLLPGSDWELEIRKAVRETDVVVVCLSKQFNQAGFRQKEVRIALDTAMEQPQGEIFIIPARLEECENLESLRKWHWVDLFEVDGYQSLIRALRARADRIGATLRIRKGGQSITPRPKSKEAEKTIEPLASFVDIGDVISGKMIATETQETQSLEKAELESAEKAAREKAERESAEKAAHEAAEKAERERVAKEERKKATQQKVEKEIQREYERMIKKAKRDLWWGRLKIDIQYRLELIRIYRVPILILFVGLAIMLPLSIALYNRFPELTQVPNTTTPTTEIASSKTIEPNLLPANTDSPALTPFLVCVYTVGQFQTLRDVALMFDVNRDLIQDINGNLIDNQNQDFTGQSLIMPNIPQERCERGHGGFVQFPVSVEDIPESLLAEIVDAKGASMVLVPAGEFTMGSNIGMDDEKPLHTVFLDTFYIDKYEVTNQDFVVFLNDNYDRVTRPSTYYLIDGQEVFSLSCDAAYNPSPQDQCGNWRDKISDDSINKQFVANPTDKDDPVVLITWHGALEYCKWRSDETLTLTLSTEAQWEKAARGTQEILYPWGNEINCQYANYEGCVGNASPVGSYTSGISLYGVYDMAGNVWEWVSDWYDGNYYDSLSSNISVNPLGPIDGEAKVFRGGSWFYDATFARTTQRGLSVGDINTYSSLTVGFRCSGMP